jgi:hypothetical protein
VNLCAKINSKAPGNGMVIGSDLYQIVKSLDDFSLSRGVFYRELHSISYLAILPQADSTNEMKRLSKVIVALISESMLRLLLFCLTRMLLYR